MPRYFFHTEDGQLIRDEHGEELADMPAVRAEAVTVLGEILRYRGETFWETGDFSVIVTDDQGRPVASVTATGRDGAPEGWSHPA